MGKDGKSKRHTENKQNIYDGRDIEFSQELADADDVQAQERGAAADRRAQQK